MSLSRILNNEPSPAPSSFAAPRTVHVDSSFSPPSTLSRVSPPRSHPQHPHSRKSAEPQPYSQKAFPPSGTAYYPPDWAPPDNRAESEPGPPKRRREDDAEYMGPSHQRRVSFSLNVLRGRTYGVVGLVFILQTQLV